MPRKSPFEMKFSSAERQVLESIASRCTSPYCDVVRDKIVLLADEGLSNDLVAARLDTPPRSSASGASGSLWPDCPA
jgi:hypothetical protein